MLAFCKAAGYILTATLLANCGTSAILSVLKLHAITTYPVSKQGQLADFKTNQSVPSEVGRDYNGA